LVKNFRKKSAFRLTCRAASRIVDEMKINPPNRFAWWIILESEVEDSKVGMRLNVQPEGAWGWTMKAANLLLNHAAFPHF